MDLFYNFISGDLFFQTNQAVKQAFEATRRSNYPVQTDYKTKAV